MCLGHPVAWLYVISDEVLVCCDTRPVWPAEETVPRVHHAVFCSFQARGKGAFLISWLVSLSIFSCTPWPFVYFLWSNVYFRSLRKTFDPRGWEPTDKVLTFFFLSDAQTKGPFRVLFAVWNRTACFVPWLRLSEASSYWLPSNLLHAPCSHSCYLASCFLIKHWHRPLSWGSAI